MSIKIGINGCGRIGKLLVRLLAASEEFEITIINDPMPASVLVNLLRYDSQHGRFEGINGCGDDFIEIGSSKIALLHKRTPKEIPWGDFSVDCVLEASGMFKTRAALEMHLVSGAKKVVLCQPSDDRLDGTIVIGVNDYLLQPEHSIISNSSCTTNCVAPLLKVLNEEFGVEKAFFNTVHPYTNNQSLHDGPHNDLRRSRAALCNIIPTTSTAVVSLQKVMLELAGRVDGLATRVPVSLGAYVEITALLQQNVTVDNVNQLFQFNATGSMKGIIEYCSDPIVSTDIIGNPHSAIFDSLCTKVIGGNFVQLLAWYDNETGYSYRIVDLIKKLYRQSDSNILNT
jgi:glyceraldehyde 3-phosphate dehydrogenase